MGYFAEKGPGHVSRALSALESGERILPFVIHYAALLTIMVRVAAS